MKPRRLRRALLVSYLSTHFVELIRVARALQRTGRWCPVVWFAQPYHERDQNLETCRREGIEVQLDHPAPAEPPGRGPEPAPVDVGGVSLARALGRLPEPAKQLLRRVRDPLWSLRRAAAAVRDAFRHYRIQLERARSTLAAAAPDLLVLAEDNVGYDTPCLVKAAHDRGVPSVVVPYTIATALEPAEAYLGTSDFHVAGRLENRLAARLFPRWVFEHKGQRLLRLPGARVLAMEALGLAPPVPWVHNSGAADAVAVESEAMREHYGREGFPSHQLVVTGALYDDVLAETAARSGAREELMRELGAEAGRRILLCALPPDVLYLRRGITEFGSYRELVEYWTRTLAALPGFQVVVSLHPRHSYQSLRFLEDWGPKVARRDVAELVPLCDLYVACVSATIRLAIGCGKPVVNYDCYRYRYGDYARAKGVITVEEKRDFEAVLDRMALEPGFLEAAAVAQEREKERWARLDGGAEERMTALFDRLTSGSGAAGRRVAGEPL